MHFISDTSLAQVLFPRVIVKESTMMNFVKVSGLIPGASNLEKLFIWMIIYGLTQKQTVTELYSLSAKGER